MNERRDYAVRDFVANVPDAELADLRERLDRARLPETETVHRPSHDPSRWDQGVPRGDLVEIVNYWRNEYDWSRFEDQLNDIGQYVTDIEGLDIHFLHRRSPRPDAAALILTHGWPGSVAEFVDIIDELSDPQDESAQAFHVVAPSLPGFGFSGKPAAMGWGTERIAAAWVELMGRLGYSRFLAHGGDWGGPITTILGGRFPEHILGIHSTYAAALPGVSRAGLTASELEWVDRTADFWRNHAAYAKQQATRPQTIGYSLVDSPVGLLAWILDKFAEWSDTAVSPLETISLDRILGNVTLYWLTGAGASAARLYFESHDSLDPKLLVDVPSAITMYPADISSQCPRVCAQRRYRNIVRWTTPDAGGHFPSLERPEYFLQDLREGLGAMLSDANVSGYWGLH